MALAQEDIDYIKAHLGEWLAEQSLGHPPAVYEIELRERNATTNTSCGWSVSSRPAPA
ncbi:hypothetical protein [Caldichromatium japonicum]|uniref:hypothetical protein n=1 Tax=Caldichromatium japonicum TaxID=2699430 RepID=UPI001FE54868|nr:hypothetical protein [Caldichromatium japonicum]